MERWIQGTGVLVVACVLATEGVAQDLEIPKQPAQVVAFVRGRGLLSGRLERLPTGALQLRGDQGTDQLVAADLLAWLPDGRPAAVEVRRGVRFRASLTDGGRVTGIVEAAGPKSIELLTGAGPRSVERRSLGAVTLVAELPERWCERCRGLGALPTLDPCAVCEGKGRTPCKKCDVVTATVECPRHSGAECATCLGTGTVKVFRCGDCKGQGFTLARRVVGGRWADVRVACRNCGSKGIIGCGECRGPGSMPCKTCAGQRGTVTEKDCVVCRGSGEAGTLGVPALVMRRRLADASLTDLQRRHAWSTAQGQVVEWAATVAEVTEANDALLLVAVERDPQGGRVVSRVRYPKTALQALLRLQPDAPVRFTARLRAYSNAGADTIFELEAVDGTPPPIAGRPPGVGGAGDPLERWRADDSFARFHRVQGDDLLALDGWAEHNARRVGLNLRVDSTGTARLNRLPTWIDTEPFKLTVRVLVPAGSTGGGIALGAEQGEWNPTVQGTEWVLRTGEAVQYVAPLVVGWNEVVFHVRPVPGAARYCREVTVSANGTTFADGLQLNGRFSHLRVHAGTGPIGLSGVDLQRGR